MSRSFLIDTNVLIGLEDNKPVAAEFADMVRISSQHGVTLFVHEASEEDVKRDPDPTRRATTLSKIAKFQRLVNVPTPSRQDLENQFGPISNDNDLVDVKLLNALDRGIVDFLISEDIGLHKRARNSGLAGRVFRVQDALEWLNRTFDPTKIHLPYVVERKCYQLDPADPIFDTLREDYPEFDAWFKRFPHRPCWVLDINGKSAGIIIRKDNEPRHETEATLPGERILKISTFKVREEYRGEKFGEHLLKQALWHAQKNGYQIVYLTAFPDKQQILIDLLLQFGFEKTVTKSNGEIILEKALGSGPVGDPGEPLALDVKHYPRFVEAKRVNIYCVPIQPRWHRKLFPENDPDPQMSLLDPQHDDNRTPGNTIRKVYLCRAQIKSLKRGDILLFYVSGDSPISGVVRTVGIVEDVHVTSDASELLRLTGRRSVYTEEEQIEMLEQKPTPIKVMNFLLVGHFEDQLSLDYLTGIGALKAWPQSITAIKEVARAQLDLNHRLGY